MSNDQYRFCEFVDLGGLFGPLRGIQANPVAEEAPRGSRLALRVIPETANASSFHTLLDELEERFLATSSSTGSDGDIRTVIVSLWSDKRPLLEETLSRHGYRIKDETAL